MEKVAKIDLGLQGTWREAIEVAWPAVLENLFLSLAGIIDTLMVSNLGAFAVASVGLTSQPKFLFFTVFIAMSVSVSALVARRKGQNDQAGANETLVTALTLTLIFCGLITAIAVVFAEPILRFAGSNIDTHKTATLYFRIIMGGMFFNVVSMIINAAQRGSGNTKIAFTTNFVSTIVNISFNFLLIEGHLGFPRLGVAGAALATVFGTVVAFFMSLASLFREISFVQVRFILKEKIRATLRTVKSIGDLAFSIMLENMAMRVGFIATAFMAARLGTNAFAVHQVGMNLLSLGFAFGNGMQVAAVSLTGRSLGAGNKELAKRFGDICQQIGLLISIGLAIFLFFAGDDIFMLYFHDPSMLASSRIVVGFTVFVVLGQISQIIFAGCLRAAGDVKYTLFASIVSVTIIRTLVTIVLVGYFKLGLIGIWAGILSDQISRFIFMSSRYKQGNWVHISI